MSYTKQQAMQLGIKIKPVIHSMHRRAEWNDYYMSGRYGITIHILTDKDGCYDKTEVLSHVVGSCKDGTVSVELTGLGRLVQAKIEGIGSHEHEEDVKVIHYVIMPTHIHMTVEISKKLPVITRGKHKERYHIGRIIGYMKSGTTTWYRRLLLGESVEDILARPNWRDIYNEDGSRKDHPADDAHSCQGLGLGQRLTTDVNKEDVNNDVNNDANNGASKEEHTGAPIDEAKIKKTSLWEQGYNDKILNTHRKLSEWIYYEDKNPYFWKIEEEYPELFEKRLHINIRMTDGETIDFSAYGCMFLLRKGERVAVKCSRLARKGWLTEEEWRTFSSPEQARHYEEERKTKPLGRWDRGWLQSNDPNSITPIPYTNTKHYSKTKENFLSMARNNIILVSPAISEGERDIIYTTINEGHPVIKLSKDPFKEKRHPINTDRDACAKGLMLALAPWSIPKTEASGNIPAETNYAKFHDLNILAVRMCDEITDMQMVKC